MMKPASTIIVTGAAGFIGSYLVAYLNDSGFDNIIIVDEFHDLEKHKNYERKKFIYKIEREDLFDWLKNYKTPVDFFFHLGARTDTTEFDYAIHQHLNVEYSQQVWKYCTENNVPLIYASSAATYGNGNKGYSDSHQLPFELEPLNPYGISKNEFDKWALQQDVQPPFWAGLKFFNVYGPNEYHKARMASVIYHSFNQVSDSGFVKLFKSHKADFKDGEQLRDFIYVKDIASVCNWLMNHRPPSGLYNLGTGEARSFNNLVTAVFTSLDLTPDIRYIDMPEDIRESYQYFTEADMFKLKAAGYVDSFHSLENGIYDYVSNFLSSGRIY